MASALSVDAREFIPGDGIADSKVKLCSSLSVDAPIFVPIVTEENFRENVSPNVKGKQGNKSSVVQRRGRFAQVDSRGTPSSNLKNVDVFAKTSIPAVIKKDSNDGRGIKVPSNGDKTDHKNSYVGKDSIDKKKLKQSFSLEYSKRRKQHATTRQDLEERTISDLIGDIQQTNKIPPSANYNSGESKPIILWSSIVKQDPNTESKTPGVNANQDKNNEKIKVPDDEKPASTKKYVKNKVTRTKNVLAEPLSEKFYSKERKEKRVEKKNDDIGIKPMSEQLNFVAGSTEDSNKVEKKLSGDGVISNSVVNKPVVKTPKKKNKEKIAVKPGGNIQEKRSDDETRRDLKTEPFKRMETNDPRRTSGKQVAEFLRDVEDRVRTLSPKKKNDELKGEMSNKSSKWNKSKEIVEQTGANNINAEEYLNLNLSDNSSFPALTMKNVPTTNRPLSYSAVAKKLPVPVSKPSAPLIDNATKNMLDAINNFQLTEEEQRAMKKRHKALKRKMRVKQKKQEAKLGLVKPENTKMPEKASDKEITFDLSDMFSQLLKMPPAEKKSVKSKKMKMSTGVISVASGMAKKNTPDGRRVEKNKYGGTHTIMDGSTIRKRGKERETPKKKRPTLLKKVITAERERKRVLLENKHSTDITKDDHEEEETLTESEKPVVEKVEQISDLPEDIWKKIHSKKFREYCDHVLTKEINNLTYNLLVTLQKFQDRVYHENPIKYKQKRRYILGLREVLKHLKLKRLKAVIIAPNIERISAKGGLDDYLGSIISICNEQQLPKIFAMNRHVLGRVIKKLAPVSVIGIFDYDGAHEIFKELIDLVQLAKVTYTEKVNSLHNDEIAKKELGQSLHKTVNSMFIESMNKGQKTRSNEDEGVKQILNKLYSNEYRSYDAESESDAWVTDNESIPL